jgi:4-amino-4-deoxy-L-arabinose transferase-like glycosyltransferase
VVISTSSPPKRGRSYGALSELVARASARPVLGLLPLLFVFVVVPLVAPANDNLYDDEAGYLRLAKNLVAGHYLTGRNTIFGGGAYPNLWFGPGLPILIAPLAALHVPPQEIRLLGPAFLFAAVLLFYRLLRLAVSARASFLGALALGLYVPLYTVIAFVHSEPLALLLVVAASYAIALYVRGGRRRHLAAAGACLAYLALTRVEFGWVLAILLAAYVSAWLVRRRVSLARLVVVYALSLVLCVPWLAYTYSVTGSVFLWGNSGPLSLYWITSPYPRDRGDWHRADWVFTDPHLAPHRPFFRTLEGIGLNAQNARLEHAAFSNIRHKPLKFAENVAANVSRMLFNVPYSFKPAKRTGLVYSLPAALLLAGLIAAWRHAPRRDRKLPPETAAFASFAIAAFALHAVLAGYPRLLFPIVPIAIWFAVVWWSAPSAEAVDA